MTNTAINPIYLSLMLGLVISLTPTYLTAQQRLQAPNSEVTRFSASNGVEFGCYQNGPVRLLKRPANIPDHVRVRKILRRWFLKRVRENRRAARLSGDRQRLRRARNRFQRRRDLFLELNAICEPDQSNPDQVNNSLSQLSRALTEMDIRRLADVAGYGIRAGNSNDAALLAQRSQGVSAVVDSFMTYRPEEPGFETTRSNWLGGNPDQQQATTKDGINLSSMFVAVNTNNQFHKKLFEFLNQLITIADDTFSQSAFDMAMVVSYHDMLRNAANDQQLDYKLLYRQMITHPAMLRYLDGDLNTGCADETTNENAARENKELFSIGTHKLCEAGVSTPTPTYTEADVAIAARAHTGWRIIPGSPDEGGWVPANHCPGPHTLFAGTAEQITISSLDDFVNSAIFGTKRNDAALFLAEQLALFYLTDSPNCALLNAIANEIKDNDFKLRPVIAKILKSEVFYDGPQNRIAKGVFDYIATVVRNAGIPISISIADSYVKSSDSRIHSAPTVFYYFPEDLTDDARQVEKINFIQRRLCRDDHAGWSPHDTLIPSGNPGAIDVINHIATLFNVSLSLDQRLQLLEALNSNASGASDPFDASNPNHISRVLSQVCFPIAASPQAQLR